MKHATLFWAVLASAVLLRVFLIYSRSAAFAFDMGRDLLWAKDISFYHIPTLIGPAGSIWGVYFGPLWFYLLSVPLRVTNGNPLSAVYTTMVLVALAGVFAYFLFKKTLKAEYALLFSLIMLFNSAMIGVSIFAFHANALPLLTLILIYFCFIAVVKKPEAIALALFFASLMFHADPAPAVVFSVIVPLVYFYFKLYKKGKIKKILLLSTLAYTLPFVPQIVFEIRNNFTQSKSLIAYFEGANQSLSGQLPLLARILNRIDIFYNQFASSTSGGNNYVAALMVLFIAFGIYRFMNTNYDKNLNVLLKLVLLATLAVYLIFTFIISVEIKGWYLAGMPVLYAFLILFAFLGFKNYKGFFPVIIIAFIIINVVPHLKPDAGFQKDPVLLSNQLKAVSIIYNDPQDADFSVYTYTPAIYDFNYQYLFWWKGIAQHAGLPADFAYLPNQPDYVRNKDVYAKKQDSSAIVYLIIENASSNQFYTLEDWLTNFNGYGLVWEKDVAGAIKIQKRERSAI